MLTDPFPDPSQNLVDSGNASPSQVMRLSSFKRQDDALISTLNKNHGNSQLLDGKIKGRLGSSTTTSTEAVPPSNTRSSPTIHGGNHPLQYIGVIFLKGPSLMGTFVPPPPSNLTEMGATEYEAFYF